MPWNTNDVWKFLLEVLKVGGTSAVLVFGLVKWFGEKWLDKHFAEQLEKVKLTNQQELEQTKHAIQSMFSRIVKIHDKEYEVLPKAWLKFHTALGSANTAVASLRMREDLVNMPEAELRDFLQSSKLQPHQKDEILLLTRVERQHYYSQIMTEKELSYAMERQRIFNNYLIEHRIFMTKEIAALFDELSDALSLALKTYAIGDAKERFEAVKTIVDLKDRLPEVQKLIQERLCYEKA